MTLVAAPEQQATVKNRTPSVPRRTIDSLSAFFEKIRINASDGLTGPEVQSIEVNDKKVQWEGEA